MSAIVVALIIMGGLVTIVAIGAWAWLAYNTRYLSFRQQQLDREHQERIVLGGQLEDQVARHVERVVPELVRSIKSRSGW